MPTGSTNVGVSKHFMIGFKTAAPEGTQALHRFLIQSL